jgi:hypothetical protein
VLHHIGKCDEERQGEMERVVSDRAMFEERQHRPASCYRCRLWWARPGTVSRHDPNENGLLNLLRGPSLSQRSSKRRQLGQSGRVQRRIAKPGTGAAAFPAAVAHPAVFLINVLPYWTLIVVVVDVPVALANGMPR